MVEHKIQWDMVSLLVAFLGIALFFDRKKKPRKPKVNIQFERAQRGRGKRSGFRRMQSPAERAYARARSRSRVES